MPGSNKLLYVALGLVAIVTAVIGWWSFPILSPTQQFRYDSPRNENYRPGGSQCEPSALAAIADAKVRLHQTDNCQKKAEEYRQASDDLIQQTRAANAAQAQADIASQQLWAGWLQTLGGFLTLAAAAGAAIYARDAAKESRRSANEAEASHKSFIAGERGHLLFINSHAGETAGKLEIILNLKNSGKSVAEIDGISYGYSGDGLWPNALDLGEGLQVKISYDEMKSVSIKETMPVQFPAIIAGYVRYSTLTLKDCRTHFILHLDRGNPSYGPQLFSAQAIDNVSRPHDT